MIKRVTQETVGEYDKDGRLVRQTVTETTEDDDNPYWLCGPAPLVGSYVSSPMKSMQRVGEFEKVSFEQFYKAMKDEFGVSEAEAMGMYDLIGLPTRSSTGSAGYDFRSPMSFVLKPGKTIKIPTGIRVRIEPGWWLACVPRSGLGFKYRMQFDNTIGVIDGDYYGSDNEGQIYAKITNDGREGKEILIKAGDRFMQAIFLPYGITYSDNVVAVRNGGIGSTGA